jgi:hypothetical protein
MNEGRSAGRSRRPARWPDAWPGPGRGSSHLVPQHRFLQVAGALFLAPGATVAWSWSEEQACFRKTALGGERTFPVGGSTRGLRPAATILSCHVNVAQFQVARPLAAIDRIN